MQSHRLTPEMVGGLMMCIAIAAYLAGAGVGPAGLLLAAGALYAVWPRPAPAPSGESDLARAAREARAERGTAGITGITAAPSPPR